MAEFVYEPNEAAELRELRQSLRDCLEKLSSESRVREVSAGTGGYDRELWQRLTRDFGAAGVTLPAEVGGQGLGPVENGVLLEELGRSLACVPVLASAVLGAGVLAAAPDAVDLLPDVASGRVVATVAVGPGSPPAAAVGPGARWTVSGRVDQVLYGDSADLILVLARTATNATAFFAVPAGSAGLTVTARPTLDQTRPLSTVSFADAPARLVGAADGGPAILTRVLTRARAALAAEQLGAATRVLEMATRYAALRIQFDRPIGSFQAVKHACATMFVSVHLGRGITYSALAADGARAVGLARAAVAYTGDALGSMAAANVQIHGAMGFAWEHPAHLYVKRAAGSQHLFFGAEAARSELERDLLG